MRIISTSSCEEAKTKAIDYLIKELTAGTSQGKDVLWLLSGGSAIDVTIGVTENLGIAVTKRIIIAQVDERFVPPGSKDENWQQLINAGFSPNNFKQTVSILSTGSQPDSIATNYSQLLKQLFDQTETRVGLLGIGADGHTAGIKPMENPKDFAIFTGADLVVSYQAEDFVRITITAAAIKQLSNVVVYACGEEKRPVINQLNAELPAHSQPAQLLKHVSSAVVFN